MPPCPSTRSTRYLPASSWPSVPPMPSQFYTMTGPGTETFLRLSARGPPRIWRGKSSQLELAGLELTAAEIMTASAMPARTATTSRARAGKGICLGSLLRSSEARYRDRLVLDVSIGGLDPRHGFDRIGVRGGRVSDGVRSGVVLRDSRGRVDHRVVRDGEAGGLLVQIDAQTAVICPLTSLVVVQIVVLDLRVRLLIRERINPRSVGQDLDRVVNVVVVDLVGRHRVDGGGPAVSDRDGGVVRVRDLVVLDVDQLGIAGSDADATLEFGGHVVDVVVLDRVARADLVLVGRVVGDVVLGRVARGELADRDAIASNLRHHVADDHVVVRP